MNFDPVKIRLLSSLALAAFAAGASWLYLDYKEAEILEKGETIKILVASKYVPALTRLDTEWLAYREIPKTFAPRGYAQKPEAILGQITLVPFNYKEPFIFNKLSDTGARLSDAIPERMRAFTLGVDKVTGLAGLVRPGDLVDIYHFSKIRKKDTDQILFQAVKVLAVAGSQDLSSEENRSSTVTLALSPANCSRALIASASGRLQLALRPSGDKRILSNGPASASDSSLRTPTSIETPRTNKNEKDLFIIRKR